MTIFNLLEKVFSLISLNFEKVATLTILTGTSAVFYKIFESFKESNKKILELSLTLQKSEDSLALANAKINEYNESA